MDILKPRSKLSSIRVITLPVFIEAVDKRFPEELSFRANEHYATFLLSHIIFKYVILRFLRSITVTSPSHGRKATTERHEYQAANSLVSRAQWAMTAQYYFSLQILRFWQRA
jgi:hypothetical protein